MRPRSSDEPLLQNAAIPEGLERHVLSSGGRERLWFSAGPAVRAERTAAVVLLHGAGANALGAVRMSGFDRLAREEGFLAVFPDGSGPAPDRFLFWNSGGRELDRFRSEADDVTFLEELCAQLAAVHGVDPDRIYMTGFSNGAMMCHRFAAERPHRIAAFAAVAGSLPEACRQSAGEPVTAVLLHGTSDDYVPYAGGRPRKSIVGTARTDVSFAESVRYWVERDRCRAIPEEFAAGSHRIERYGGGRGGSEVVVCTVRGGGHAWPGGRAGLANGNPDEPYAGLDASRWIWEECRRHRREGGVLK
ncbi:MAG: hypothetical protein MOGMAGMI_01532 [Candidatus Omnitrophica bacterium]|nr:hypothetical protein [Candidatus Omnitrophota bacterium]